MGRGESAAAQAAIWQRPLLLLDVDGVVAPLDSSMELDQLPSGFERARIGPYEGFVPSYLRQSLAALADQAEIVWVTSWEEEAPKVIAPLFGLPCTDRALALSPLRREIGGNWSQAKLVAVKAEVGERPFAWIDDDMTSAAKAWAKTLTMPNLLIKPKRNLGLAQKDFRRLERFFAGLAQ